MNQRIRFYLRYYTYYGQNLYLTGNIPALGNNLPQNAYPMQWLNNDWWFADIHIPANTLQQLEYQYLLKESNAFKFDGIIRSVTLPPDQSTNFVFTDTWMEASDPQLAWLSDPFTKIFTPRNPQVPEPATHQFKVKAPLLPAHQTICIMGDDLPNGNWNTDAPLLLQTDHHGWFTAALNLADRKIPMAYKYGIYDTVAAQFIRYEEGCNRSLNTTALPDRQVVLHDGYVQLPVQPWKGNGIAAPLSALRSADGFGTGEFADLPLLARWAKKNNLEFIQLQPVNDTIQTNTCKDSDPYAIISSFALHPMYIRLHDVGKLPDNHLLEKQFCVLRKWLNEKKELDYETVTGYKMAYLRALHELEGEKLQTEKYWDWFDENEYWLLPYAVFCALRNKYNSADPSAWPVCRHYDARTANRLLTTDQDLAGEVHFWFYVQYHLHLQLRKAVDDVHETGVALKNDVPIGVVRNSVDVWIHPEYFNLDMQMGAPPDSCYEEGQNWGFPAYNWDVMQQDGLSWWQQKLKYLSAYFDACRIDQLPGFFRTWQIPASSLQAILGYFQPAIPVSKEEILQSGIRFDEERFCSPYITDEILDAEFGHYAGIMAAELMEPLADGRYKLQEAYATQKLVCTSTLPDAVKSILYRLQTNVLLIKVVHQHTTVYHPRYQLMSASSFSALDINSQLQLHSLYNDYFYNRQERVWSRSGNQKLPLIRKATNMLICGEDREIAPSYMSEVLKELGIPGLVIERMPKASNNDYLNRLRTGMTNNEEPSVLRIFHLQDLLAAPGNYTLQEPEKEQINIPSEASSRYRMPVDITHL